ncbi:MAG TPA: SLATT domain-containing protein [Polyangia bacterium]|nr:SLATT domain-containing protein [Polyangia bacterium]
MGEDLLGDKLGQWRGDDWAKSLEALYGAVEARALSSIKWYMNARRSHSLWSKLLRGATLLFAVAGTLVPLVDAINGRQKWVSFEIGQWGYVCFAIAGAFVLIDRYFGLSSAWMRFSSTGLILQRELRRFQLDWASAFASVSGDNLAPADAEKFLDLLKRFSATVEDEIERETNTWIAEFRSGLADLERLAKEPSARGGQSGARASAARDTDAGSAPSATPREPAGTGASIRTPELPTVHQHGKKSVANPATGKAIAQGPDSASTFNDARPEPKA